MKKSIETLLYQLLETEIGGVQVYEAALPCAVNEDLKEEWTKYLDETRRHVDIARGVVEAAGLDPERDVPGRTIARKKAAALVQLMNEALEAGDPEEAQLVACEAVVDAETKDHQNWEILSKLAGRTKGALGATMRAAAEEVEEEEDRHLYHTKGWARELWFQGLGLRASLPPPEEEKDVTTAIGAERAKRSARRSRRRVAKTPARRRR